MPLLTLLALHMDGTNSVLVLDLQTSENLCLSLEEYRAYAKRQLQNPKYKRRVFCSEPHIALWPRTLKKAAKFPELDFDYHDTPQVQVCGSVALVKGRDLCGESRFSVYILTSSRAISSQIAHTDLIMLGFAFEEYEQGVRFAVLSLDKASQFVVEIWGTSGGLYREVRKFAAPVKTTNPPVIFFVREELVFLQNDIVVTLNFLHLHSGATRSFTYDPCPETHLDRVFVVDDMALLYP